MNVFRVIHGDLKQGFLDFDSYDLAMQLGGDDIEDFLYDQPITNEPISSIWKSNVTCNVMPYFQNSSVKFPDLSRWGGHTLIVSEKAKSLLENEFECSGELLPLTVSGTAMYIYNCLTFGDEDTELTTNEYDAGIKVGLKSLAFIEEDIAKKPLFKSKLAGTTRLFANSDFKSKVESFGLTGIKFDCDLLGAL